MADTAATPRKHDRRVVLCGLHQLFEALVPVAIGAIVANAIAPGDRTALVAWLAALALLFIALTYSWRLGARLVVAAMEGEGHSLRVEVTDTLLRPRGVRTDMRAGELLSVATSDADRTTWILDLVARAVASAVAVIATAVILFVIDVPLGLGVLVGTAGLFAALHFAAPVIAHRTAEQQARIGTASGVATDLVTGLRRCAVSVVRPQQGSVSAQSAPTPDRHAQRCEGPLAVRGCLDHLERVARSGDRRLGGLAGTQRTNRSRRGHHGGGSCSIPDRTTHHSGAGPCRRRGVTRSADRVARVLDSAPLLDPGRDDVTHRDQGPVLELADLRYRTLDGLDLAVARGEFVGIVAYRPEDADAVFALLSSQVPAGDYTGSFTVGSVLARDLPIELARTLILAEPHDTFLFAGTLGSNITAGRGPAASIDLERALERPPPAMS